MALTQLAHIVLTLAGTAIAAFDLGMGSDDDLTDFVTRPEIKAPKFNVTIHDPTGITPGYWFLAPYTFVYQESHAAHYYQPCQTGPAIYDGAGELIWSGACHVRNQNTFDFRPWQINGSSYVSGILTTWKDVDDRTGHGFLVDNTFEAGTNLQLPADLYHINMHGLAVIDNGTRAIYIQHKPVELRTSDLRPNDVEGTTILDFGFREVDVASGDTIFDWWAYRQNHVAVDESVYADVEKSEYDWLHGNSVDKNAEGDYIFSARYADTIYKISGRDGRILWRLGGRNTSFSQDFNFSRQHDARWLPSPDRRIERISFLNNGADENSRTQNTSTAVVVDLHLNQMKATLVRGILRPDGHLTRLRGNHQILDNGNSFVCWSENTYLSEHSPDGKVLFEARFASWRFVTYRAYKANFTAAPKEPPVAKAFVYGTSRRNAVTVVYASWNGATEVASWRYRSNGVVVGQTSRQGFETMFQLYGHHAGDLTVEALDVEENVLGSVVPDISDLTTGAPSPGYNDGSAYARTEPLGTLAPTGLAFFLHCLFAALMCFTLGLSCRRLHQKETVQQAHECTGGLGVKGSLI